MSTGARPGAPGELLLPDLVGPRVTVLLCGTNPGLMSARVGHHFARPGNRFWPVLHAAGFTDRVLRPSEQGLLVDLGVGLTNLVRRCSASAAELSAGELRAGARALEETVAACSPAHVAVLGVQAYRVAFGRPRAVVGRQDEELAGATLWVLPNPSGLQAHYQLPQLAALYGELRRAAGIEPAARESEAPAPGRRGAVPQDRRATGRSGGRAVG